MRTFLPWLLMTALFAYGVAHVLITVTLARRGEWPRAVLAFFLPPLAPLWAWRAGMRRPVYTWAVALFVYAVGVALA